MTQVVTYLIYLTLSIGLTVVQRRRATRQNPG